VWAALATALSDCKKVINLGTKKVVKAARIKPAPTIIPIAAVTHVGVPAGRVGAEVDCANRRSMENPLIDQITGQQGTPRQPGG
jgi:hypothetical protein